MNTRSIPTTTFGQGESARRRIRRSTTSGRTPYCRTNGCTTFMQPDGAGSAVCPICGARSRLH